jgi:hypothetical protein
MKTFTVEQANRTLPLVSRIVQDIVTQHARWRECVRQSELIAAAATPARPDERVEAIEREIQALAEEIAGYIQELEQIGVEFKGFDLGLVDFPAEISGRRVYLCWRLGEPAVEHWHEIDAGYSGRRRLSPVGVLANN